MCVKWFSRARWSGGMLIFREKPIIKLKCGRLRRLFKSLRLDKRNKQKLNLVDESICCKYINKYFIKMFIQKIIERITF